jgi:hypothetical protein
MAARRLTPAQARERKTKITAICLAAVFVAVAAIQGPTLLKALHKPSAKAAAAPAATPAQASVAPVIPGQLTSFSRFPLQDPFHAQVAVAATNGTTSTTATKPATAPVPQAKPAPKPKQAPTLPTATTPTVPFTTTPVPVEPPNAALITLNGRRQIVPVGSGFPKLQPLFKLVALGKKKVKIGVLGGSFTSGAPTLALLRGRPITLANEADGSRYTLRLVRLTVATLPVVPSKSTG